MQNTENFDQRANLLQGFNQRLSWVQERITNLTKDALRGEVSQSDIEVLLDGIHQNLTGQDWGIILLDAFFLNRIKYSCQVLTERLNSKEATGSYIQGIFLDIQDDIRSLQSQNAYQEKTDMVNRETTYGGEIPSSENYTSVESYTEPNLDKIQQSIEELIRLVDQDEISRQGILTYLSGVQAQSERSKE